uniref:Uncharacterized protein n=1 Tax=Anguilla anguilla TaxID=7936 RepID=A0A0E9UPC1_ANGAN
MKRSQEYFGEYYHVSTYEERRDGRRSVMNPLYSHSKPV